MEFGVESGTLEIKLVNRISTDNATEIGDEITKIRSDNDHESVILDAAELTYISSAGLRILLKVAKQEKNLKVINVSNEVNEIFNVTGFSHMLKIERALRKVSIEGCKLIGEGFFSKVYRLDDDTIVKVFIRDTVISDIKRELDLSKQAFVLGVPTAISYDIVQAGDKLGVVFEMLDCESLRDAVRDGSADFEELMSMYAKLLKTLNTTDVKDTKLPSAKQIFLDKVELVKPFVESAEYEKLRSLAMAVPDRHTFVHGDCHFKNIMCTGDELLLIDMDTLSCGHPVFELGALYTTYKVFCDVDSDRQEKFMGVKAQVTYDVLDRTLQNYFEGKTEEEFSTICDKIALVAYSHLIAWTVMNNEQDTRLRSHSIEKLKELLPKVKSLDF